MKDNVVDLLVCEWNGGGIITGDTVLLHSNLKRLVRRYKKLGYEVSAELVLESLLQAVGPSGTLIFPLFNFEFTQGIEFDIHNTPSHMGALSEVARLHPGAVRTGHPIYSFAVIGFHSNRFKGLKNYSGYGPDSPFALLRELNGKVAVLNLPDQNSMTFYHHVEEMMNVSYRFHKTFTGVYRDETGTASRRTFSLFVRNIERGVVTDVNRMGEILWDLGLYKGSRYGSDFGCRTINARSLYDATADVIFKGRAREMLFSIEEGK
jgi:aminoglycoside 3-N-acetyltransferase